MQLEAMGITYQGHITGTIVVRIFLIIALATGGYAHARAEKRMPNIVLIMADDLGAEVLPCYGNTVYSTPNLDALAAEGALFENAFATPVCSPTRAMILTGLYPNRTGILERLDSPEDREQGNNRLPAHILTFGHVFQSAGYKTAIAGKWHMGDFQKHPDQPESHGFDEHCLWVQYWDGERRSRYYGPHNWENGEYIVHGKEVFGPDYYCDFLLDFMERNREKPFFAYYPMNLIHGPLVTPPGSQKAAEIRYPEGLGKKERIAGRMVYHMDLIVGRLMDKLDKLGLKENTLVIFTGDNGTSESLVSQLGDFKLRGGKRTMNEAGTRVPFIANWPGKIPQGTRKSFISLMDMLPTLAAMANIPIQHQIDGMDLSHNLIGIKGKDRKVFAMAFEGEVYFVRNNRFRLHEDGRFYNVPVERLRDRYSMEVIQEENVFIPERRLLQLYLDDFMAIEKTDTSYHIIPFGTDGDNYKNARTRANK